MRNEREINRIEKSVNGSYLGDVLNFHRKRVYAARISVILAFVVSAVTMLQLMHPAESLARDIVCGLEETAGHIHDESATQEVQIRSLLKVIDQKAAVNPPEGFAVRMLTEDVEDNLKPDVTDENVPEAADDPEERRESGNETAGGCGEIPCEHDGACYELADFYDRTDRIPTDTAFYSEDLVKRYIQSITVKTKFLVVKFKAGVEVKAKA